MFDLLIKNGIIITVDRLHTMYQNGFVAVSGSKIVEIGPMEKLPDQVDAARVIDASGCAVLPGLIDTHAHGGHCLTKTLGEHLGDGWEPMAEGIYYKYSDAEFWSADGALAGAERLGFGVTTGVSMIGNTARIGDLDIIKAHIEGTLSTGIRHITGVGCPNPVWPKTGRKWESEGSFTEYSVTPETAFDFTPKALDAFVGKYNMCDFLVMPSRMGRDLRNSDQLNIRQNTQMYRLAREYGTPIHSHCFSGDMDFLEQTSPEVFGVKMYLAHVTGMSEGEIDTLARHEVSVCHGPSTNANINCRCPAVEMLNAGVNVVVATDGTAPDRNFDLLKDVKIFQLLHKNFFHNADILPAGLALEMITIRAARAIGKEHLIGSIEVGKEADIIIIDCNRPHLAPFGVMPVQRLIYHASGADVSYTIVAGQVVMEGRKTTKVAQDGIIKNAQKAFDLMAKRSGVLEYGVENPNLWK